MGLQNGCCWFGATITLYINGKQYLTVISSGGLFSEYKEKASKIYTFSIKLK